MRRLLVGLVAVLLLAGALWYGQAPPRSASAYQTRAAQTALYLRSQSRTAGMWVRALQDGQATSPATQVALEEAESDAVTTASRFAGWDPPPGTDDLRRELTGASTELTDDLAALRIAIHAGDRPGLSSAAGRLPPLEGRLTTLIITLDPGQR